MVYENLLLVKGLIFVNESGFPFYAPVLNALKNIEKNKIGRYRSDQGHYKASQEKGAHHGTSRADNLPDNHHGFFTLAHRGHNRRKNFAMAGKSEKGCADFETIVVDEIPIQGIADPGSQGSRDLASLEKKGQGYGKSHLKGHDRHQTGKDTEGCAQGQFTGFASEAEKPEIVVSDLPGVFQRLSCLASHKG